MTGVATFIGNDSSFFKHFLWNISIISRFFPVGVNNSRPYKRTGITYIRKKKREERFVWTIGDSRMPVVGKATHIGILRTSIPNDPDSIYENIQKAKRAIYSLLPAGFHGKNGLDIQSLIQILNIYVMPVLLYGLELLTPTGKNRSR
jgi:hypothetical protein